ncbi:synaptosomal-associated protein 47-like [Babylonia areolata]|uniref:synaptosomal-associated protein 47-like n=1 Tax=Babylonia areolata TaxID=304850 RepID=UPI003FD4E3AC
MSCKIRSWKVSYYHNDQQRWVYGMLTCSPFAVRFHSKDTTHETQNAQADHHQNKSKDVTASRDDPGDLLLQYTDIKQVQRAKSMLVFPAVTVETHNGKVHWFSSLPDRHSVFNALDYFARHNLLDTDKAKKQPSGPGTQTQIGQQLLRSAEDSERTLAAAAADLHGQGRQLARASVRLMEMHEDLDAADRLLSGLNTYLGQWSLPPQYKEVEMVHISKDEVSSDHDLEVLSSELCKDQWHPQKLSFLRVTESGLMLLDSRQRLLHPFRWMDLSRAFVISPWEVVLTKHVAGRADVSVSVVSSALLPVLRLLERKASHLMDYQTPPPPEDTAIPGRESSRTKILASQGHLHTSAPRGGSHTHTHRPGHGQIGSAKHGSDRSAQLLVGGKQTTQKQTQEKVSAEEAAALCRKLGEMKSMARAVGEEVSVQNEALDGMVSNVDRATERMRAATQRMKKLM